MVTETAHNSLNLVRKTMTGGGNRHSSQFRELAEELQVLLELGNLSLIRERLAKSVGWLKSCADSMEHNETASAEQMQSELRVVQGRLHEAESLAARDCLTGLANRREAEKLMVRRIQAGRPFCIILFDLDNFKQVNDRHGHHVGDQVLKAFSNRLASQFRRDDVPCRWGGDEFLVLMASAMPEALGKANLVVKRVSGQYAMESASGSVNICVSASVGVAQHEPGESGQELFAKADALLYLHKGESNSSGTPEHAHNASGVGIGGHDRADKLADTPCRTQDAADTGGFTILIADDEAGIRTLAGEVLRSHGYNVLQAADGVEALELAAQHPGPIHLLLADLSMPRLDGRELRRRLNNVRPGTATLFMSGDLDTGLHPDAAFLPKPFATSVLVRKVNEALRVKVG
jgi:diguanylate cyclase (GGDEF)-like protein